MLPLPPDGASSPLPLGVTAVMPAAERGRQWASIAADKATLRTALTPLAVKEIERGALGADFRSDVDGYAFHVADTAAAELIMRGFTRMLPMDAVAAVLGLDRRAAA